MFEPLGLQKIKGLDTEYRNGVKKNRGSEIQNIRANIDQPLSFISLTTSMRSSMNNETSARDSPTLAAYIILVIRLLDIN